jgi:phage shock protein PspC (stress-responsive transcriptional regulator)
MKTFNEDTAIEGVDEPENYDDEVVYRKKPGLFQLYYLFLVLTAGSFVAPIVFYFIFWFFGEKTTNTIQRYEREEIRLHGRTKKQKISLACCWAFAIAITVVRIFFIVITYQAQIAQYM